MTINLDASELDRVLQHASQHLTNTEPLMEDISRQLVTETNLNFDFGGRPVWAGLSPVTLARRRGGAGWILQDTGKLKKSITSSHTIDTATVGTNLKYAPTHQFGATQGQYGYTKRNSPIPWGDIPARPFIPMDKNGDISYDGFLAVREVVNNYLAGAFA
ncbi:MULTISPECIES: phage virion morphogenesis protein [unclassified Moraxella]|uniref:phage virion morphogenesis protein n=1 Tax=unclassified Moraxella TaxID=2685852 RepID=UPI003AF47159